MSDRFKGLILPFLMKRGFAQNVLFSHTTDGAFSFQFSIASGSPLLEWGDGNSVVVSTSVSTYSHTYALAGEKTVTVSEDLQGVNNITLNGKNLTFLNFSKLVGLYGLVTFYDNPNLTEAVFGATPGAISRLWGYQTGLAVMDFSQWSDVGGDIRLGQNPNLHTLTFGASSRNVSLFNISACPLLTALDLSQMSGNFTGNFVCVTSGLTSFAAAPNMTGLTSFQMYGNKLNVIFPFGTQIRCNNIQIYGNAMSADTVNGNINQIYQHRALFSASGKTLTISGNNAAPTGEALTQIADLRANHNWTINHS